MTEIKVSILILTKNREKLLTKNLDSLVKQTFKPYEVVIVNNSSIDNTEIVLSTYKKRLPIKSFKTDISGFPQLYNFGIEKCGGDLICFLDDDCIAKKDWLEQCILAYQKYPDSIIQGNTLSIPLENIYAQIMGDHYKNWIKSNTLKSIQLKVCDNKNLAVSKNIFKRFGTFSTLQKIGSEDLEFGARLRKKGIAIIYEPKIVAWHQERTTFKDFIVQHLRIAKSEAVYDSINGRQEKIGLFSGRKAYLNLFSAFKREFFYFKRLMIKELLLLPIIYLCLSLIRIYFYSEVSIKNKRE